RPDPGPTTAKIPIQPYNPAPAAPEPPPPAEPAPVSGSGARRPPAEAPAAAVIDRSVLRVADLDPAAPRGRVQVPAGAEVWVVGGGDPLPAAVAVALTGRGLRPKAFGWADPVPDAVPGSVAGLVLVAPAGRDTDPGLNRRAFGWVKAAGPRLRQAGRAAGALLATVARLDGAFGLANLAADADPTAGGLAGLAKTARHEWPEVACKALDVDPGFADARAAAAAVADEVLAVGPAEVGVTATHRCTLELARAVRRPGSPPDLGPKDVVLVTGGARGVTAEAAVALAEAFPVTLVLTGRTATPAPEPAWLAGVTGEAELKKAIAEHLGPSAGPRQVGEQYHRVVAGREVRRTLDRLAGHRAAYFAVDITDRLAVAELVRQVRAKFGPVTAVVHGAGVLADRRVEDLTPEQFDHVYGTKVGGLRNLLDLLGPDDLKVLALFSSTTARLGRVGQAAYACANEVLNKTAQAEARRRPGCRVVAVNWGPWDGGMVTPGLRKLFEAEGVGLIPPADGARFLVDELGAAGRAVEVVALARPPGAPGSGIVPAPAGSGVTPPPAATPPAPAPDLAPAFERVVDADTHPVLAAHVLDGRAVLPLAVHLEWLAHAALHGNPGLVFHGFNDLRVTSAVQVDGSGPVHLRALAGKAVKQGKTFVVPVELRGRRRDGRDAVHSRAEVVLAAALPPAPPADRPPPVTAVPYSVAEAYRDRLFHGPGLRGIEAIEGASYDAFIGTARPAPAPAGWFRAPLRSGWVADPLVLDASFQMMILWTQARHDTGSLPCFAGRYRQYRKSFPSDPTTVVIRIRRDDGTFARADIDYLDSDGRVVAQMQDYECVMEKTLNQAFRRNQLVKQ
ncbi:MAG: beta-ketoacyl synthase, partial [Isosphaera sp.]|nr:beta-ketoacyl synthase [Isosphaera sp.]